MFMNLRNWREPNKHDMQENIPELKELKKHWLEPSCPEIEMFMNLLERTQQTWWTLKNIESVFLSDWGWIMTPFITPLWHSSLSLRVLETTPSSIFRAHCHNDIKPPKTCWSPNKRNDQRKSERSYNRICALTVKCGLSQSYFKT